MLFTPVILKTQKFSQKDKERTYINLISRIASSITDDVDVIFDMFNKKDFESAIIKKLLSFEKVKTAVAADSQKETGLKFVDNLCSVIRLNKTNTDKYGFYKEIEPYAKEV